MASALKAKSAVQYLNIWKTYLRMKGVPFVDKGNGKFMMLVRELFLEDAKMIEKNQEETEKKKHLTIKAMKFFENNWDLVPKHLRLVVSCFMWVEYIIIPPPPGAWGWSLPVFGGEGWV